MGWKEVLSRLSGGSAGGGPRAGQTHGSWCWAGARDFPPCWAAIPRWPRGRTGPPAGLMREFSHVHVGVCTTDDGGSTGELVRRLAHDRHRRHAQGDALHDRPRVRWRVDTGRTRPRFKIIQQVFLHRFGNRAPRRGGTARPGPCLGALACERSCPPALRSALAGLTADMSGWLEERLRVPGHCLGNLLLTAAVFRGGRHPMRAAVRCPGGKGVGGGGGGHRRIQRAGCMRRRHHRDR